MLIWEKNIIRIEKNSCTTEIFIAPFILHYITEIAVDKSIPTRKINSSVVEINS